ncbi:MAG: 2OG-Fe(II) oxygenase [Pseudomonadota bacterium]
MSYIEVSDSAYGFFDVNVVKEKGHDLHDTFVNADPFPHIVIDDFLSPDMLEACLEAFPKPEETQSRSFDREQERFKTEFKPDSLAPNLRSFFYSLNSRPFIQFLENMTGIDGLVPDPYFMGGGFHETRQGGHLDVHVDFNLHRKLGLERRLNLLIYLNKDWHDDYGGSLELWDADVQNCVHRVTPKFNRCVVFATSEMSYHGHPTPISHPDNTPRRSLALYYYTSTWNDSKRRHTTTFKARPGTQDSVDWRVKRKEMLDDLLPPIVVRGLNKITRR